MDINFQGNQTGLRLPEKCPRCNSMDTKFCYYNNYSLTQPRHYCKTCRRYWTKGGICRNIPIGGSSYRRNRGVRAGRPRATLDPVAHTFSRRRRRPITASGGRGRGRIISSMSINFPDEFGRSMSSFGPMPLLSLNNNVVNVNNNVAPGYGTFPPPLIGGGAWHQESHLMRADPTETMFLWGLDGASGSSDGSGPPMLPVDTNVINDQWHEDLPEFTPSPPPPPPSSA